MSESQKPNSWSRSATPQDRTGSRVESDRGGQVEWRLTPLSVHGGDEIFEAAAGNPLLRLLTVFAKRRVLALTFALLLMGGAAYLLTAPAGSTLAGLPAEWCSIGLAAGAMLLAMLVTIGAWLRRLESVEDATEVLGVPLVAFEKGGAPDVR